MSFDPLLEAQVVMRRVSAHLDELAAEVHAIEHAIGDEMGRSAAVERTYIHRLQRLDYLRQSLEDLALLNLFISEQVAGPLSTEITTRLRLATTKTLLSQDATSLEVKTANGCLGDVDLF